MSYIRAFLGVIVLLIVGMTTLNLGLGSGAANIPVLVLGAIVFFSTAILMFTSDSPLKENFDKRVLHARIRKHHGQECIYKDEIRRLNKAIMKRNRHIARLRANKSEVKTTSIGIKPNGVAGAGSTSPTYRHTGIEA